MTSPGTNAAAAISCSVAVANDCRPLRDQLLEHLQGAIRFVFLQEGEQTVDQNHGQDGDAQLRQIDAGNETEQRGDPKRMRKKAKQVAQQFELPRIAPGAPQEIAAVAAAGGSALPPSSSR